MALEKEQGYLKTDTWYYDYTKEEFIDVLKKYPNIPFFVEDGIENNKYFRWNSKKNILQSVSLEQYLFNRWSSAELKINSRGNRVAVLSFIVFANVIYSFNPKDRLKSTFDILIKRKEQELLPRKNEYHQSNKKCI